MDVQDLGLSVDRRQAERRAAHKLSIPTGIVLELSQGAQDLREIAAYVANSYPGAADRLRSLAVTLQGVSEQANT